MPCLRSAASASTSPFRTQSPPRTSSPSPSSPAAPPYTICNESSTTARVPCETHNECRSSPTASCPAPFKAPARSSRPPRAAPRLSPARPRLRNTPHTRMSQHRHLATLRRRRQTPRNHPVRPLSHMLHRRPTHPLVLPHRPPWNLCLNLLRSLPFINPVVPF